MILLNHNSHAMWFSFVNFQLFIYCYFLQLEVISVAIVLFLYLTEGSQQFCPHMYIWVLRVRPMIKLCGTLRAIIIIQTGISLFACVQKYLPLPVCSKWCSSVYWWLWPLLMSLFPQPFPPSALPCRTQQKSRHLCVWETNYLYRAISPRLHPANGETRQRDTWRLRSPLPSPWSTPSCELCRGLTI